MIEECDNNTIRETALGSHDAFHSIFMKYYPRVKYFIANIVKSGDVAEDLSQDIFLKIWQSRESLPDLRSFDAYLYRMAKNAALNHLRHERVVNSFPTVSQKATTPEDLLDAKETDILIRMAIERMPEQRQKIYVMSRTGGIKNGKIAEIMGLSEKTVNNQLSLALKEIRSILAFGIIFFG